MKDHDNKKQQKPLIELERQLERFGYFSHSVLSRQADRINEIESFLYGLIDTLIDKEVVEKKKLEEIVKNVRDETLRKQEHFNAGIAIRVNQKEKAEEFVEVNCKERIHICKAVCCKLNFALSVEELELGKVKWDFGQPYFIRQKANGYCSHFDEEKTACSIYSDRPKVCSMYSCANDPRIWKDFDKMELNEDWIREASNKQKLQLQRINMMTEEKVEYKSKKE